MYELQTEAAGALLLQHALPSLSPKLTPLLLNFQADHPPLEPGACCCFAPHHITCAPCASRRDALEALIASLDADLQGCLTTTSQQNGETSATAGAPAANTVAATPKGKHRRTLSGGSSLSSKESAGKGKGKTAPNGGNRTSEQEGTVALLRTHLREVLTRQLYHSLLARSADDEPVHTHLKTLSSLRPEHLGVNAVLCMPDLWSAAVQQLKSLDSVPTPAAGLRCVLRSWDALLGVLGVWSKHAQADDFMPLMAYVVMQAQPHD